MHNFFHQRICANIFEEISANIFEEISANFFKPKFCGSFCAKIYPFLFNANFCEILCIAAIYLNRKMWTGTLLQLVPTENPISRDDCRRLKFNFFLSRKHLFSSPMTTKRLDMILEIVGSNQFVHIRVKMRVLKNVPTAPWSARNNMR